MAAQFQIKLAGAVAAAFALSACADDAGKSGMRGVQADEGVGGAAAISGAVQTAAGVGVTGGAGQVGAAAVGGTGAGGRVGAGGVPGASGGRGVAGANGTSGTTGMNVPAGAAGTPMAGAAGMPDTGAAGMPPSGGGAGGGGMGGAPMVTGPGPRIPPMPAACPPFAPGMSNIQVKGQSVTLWIGPAGTKGPMFFYWHGTGEQAMSATLYARPILTEIMSQGGVLASFSTTTKTGTNTGNGVWYTGDYEMADEIFACANAAGLIDPRRVYSAGCSAGGLQSSAMVYLRSSYLAGAAPNSGGLFRTYASEIPDRIAPLMAANGGMGVDVWILDFAETTTRQCMDVASKKGFMVQCDHGGKHCSLPADLVAAQWKFLKDHPFGVEPEPYAGGLPAGTPAYCKICK